MTCSADESGSEEYHITAINLQLNQVTGTIPDNIGNLLQLRKLVLSFNKISGTIPPSLARLKNLRKLSLHCNRLVGSIPDLNVLQYSDGCRLGGQGTKCGQNAFTCPLAPATVSNCSASCVANVAPPPTLTSASDINTDNVGSYDNSGSYIYYSNNSV